MEVNIKLISASYKNQNVFTVRSKDILQKYAQQGSKNFKQTHHLNTGERENSHSLFTVQDKMSPGAITVELTLNTVPVSMELHTGAALSLINMATYHKIAQLSQLPLQKSDIMLRTYIG